MVEIQKYVWLFPLIGGIITVISFLTPAAYFFYQYPTYRTEFFRWMLDFYVSHAYFESGVHTITIGLNTSLTGYVSMISSLAIIILSILIIVSANRYRKGKIVKKINWLVLPLITITITIAWMVLKEITTINSYNHSFWGLLSLGFGIIGLFLGTGLVLVGYIFLNKRIRKG